MDCLVNRLATTALLSILIAGAAGCAPKVGTVICSIPKDKSGGPATATVSKRPDLSGSTRLGKASFYATSFYRRKMADGNRMDPRGANAASRTLPLGTLARVTNLATGQSAIVQIEDRGPYVKVAPITVPLPDGTTKAGAGLIRPVCHVSQPS